MIQGLRRCEGTLSVASVRIMLTEFYRIELPWKESARGEKARVRGEGIGSFCGQKTMLRLPCSFKEPSSKSALSITAVRAGVL